MQARHSLVLASFFALFIAYLDRVNISVAAIAMQESLGWSETEKGLVLSSFFIGYMSAQIVGGVLADKYGGKKVTAVVTGGVVGVYYSDALGGLRLLCDADSGENWAGVRRGATEPCRAEPVRALDSRDRAFPRRGHLFKCGNCRHDCRAADHRLCGIAIWLASGVLRFWRRRTCLCGLAWPARFTNALRHTLGSRLRSMHSWQDAVGAQPGGEIPWRQIWSLRPIWALCS